MLCSDNKTKHWFMRAALITVRVQAVPVLDKNKAQMCCSERTSGTGKCYNRPLLFLVVMLAAAQWCPVVESNVSTFFMYML